MTTSMTPPLRRPLGVSLLAAFWVLPVTFLAVFAAAGAFLDGPGSARVEALFQEHLLGFVFSLLFAAAAFGLWRGRRWSWYVAISALAAGLLWTLFAEFTVFRLLLNLVALGVLSMRGARAWCGVGSAAG